MHRKADALIASTSVAPFKYEMKILFEKAVIIFMVGKITKKYRS